VGRHSRGHRHIPTTNHTGNGRANTTNGGLMSFPTCRATYGSSPHSSTGSTVLRPALARDTGA
jgi:hypothetical protein